MSVSENKTKDFAETEENADYIIEYTDISKKYEELSTNGITNEEKRLLDYYRKLSSRKKELIQEYILIED